MIASGAIPSIPEVRPENMIDAEANFVDEAEEDPPITQEQRKALFRIASEHFGQDANDVVRTLITSHGFESTSGMPVSVYGVILGEISELAQQKQEEMLEQSEAEEADAPEE